MRKTDINIIIHRRDYRTDDNAALNKLVNKYPEIPVMHIFIFNPKQIEPSRNPYFNNNCVEFMVQSLKQLKSELNDALYFFYGIDTDVLKKLISKYRVIAVAWNLDYTPFARSRDTYLQNWCTQIGIETVTAEDYSLFSMNSIKNNNKKPYVVYTPFYRKCLAQYEEIQKPNYKNYTVFACKPCSSLKNIDVFYQNTNLQLKVKGGRDHALAILEKIRKGEYRNYDHFRDFPSLDKTTKLSAYIKFGCVSIREVFYALKESYGIHHGLIRELLWREFYAHLTWHFPELLSGKSYKDIPFQWESNKTFYDQVMNAKTGYPIVDAAIRELLQTGWMNNRLRMVVASFITKDLALDWRIFERDLFARHLVDYDPSTNCHSWQGMASVGVDATPYWRIINPFIQTKKFDNECKYIKKYVPELAHVPADQILSWRTQQPLHNYPLPMVDHDEQVKKYLQKWQTN